jgi:hypothetical protein
MRPADGIRQPPRSLLGAICLFQTDPFRNGSKSGGKLAALSMAPQSVGRLVSLGSDAKDSAPAAVSLDKPEAQELSDPALQPSLFSTRTALAKVLPMVLGLRFGPTRRA